MLKEHNVDRWPPRRCKECFVNDLFATVARFSSCLCRFRAGDSIRRPSRLVIACRTRKELDGSYILLELHNKYLGRDFDSSGGDWKDRALTFFLLPLVLYFLFYYVEKKREKIITFTKQTTPNNSTRAITLEKPKRTHSRVTTQPACRPTKTIVRHGRRTSFVLSVWQLSRNDFLSRPLFKSPINRRQGGRGRKNLTCAETWLVRGSLAFYRLSTKKNGGLAYWQITYGGQQEFYSTSQIQYIFILALN